MGKSCVDQKEANSLPQPELGVHLSRGGPLCVKLELQSPMHLSFPCSFFESFGSLLLPHGAGMAHGATHWRRCLKPIPLCGWQAYQGVHPALLETIFDALAGTILVTASSSIPPILHLASVGYDVAYTISAKLALIMPWFDNHPFTHLETGSFYGTSSDG